MNIVKAIQAAAKTKVEAAQAAAASA